MYLLPHVRNTFLSESKERLVRGTNTCASSRILSIFGLHLFSFGLSMTSPTPYSLLSTPSAHRAYGQCSQPVQDWHESRRHRYSSGESMAASTGPLIANEFKRGGRSGLRPSRATRTDWSLYLLSWNSRRLTLPTRRDQVNSGQHQQAHSAGRRLCTAPCRIPFDSYVLCSVIISSLISIQSYRLPGSGVGLIGHDTGTSAHTVWRHTVGTARPLPSAYRAHVHYTQYNAYMFPTQDSLRTEER